MCYYIEWPSFTSAVIAAISGLAIFVSICILIVNNVDKNGTIERLQIRHDMLVYQYENDIYNNDNDIGYRDLVVDIQDWNESLGYKKKMQNDLWLGVFIPNIYDQFDYIYLEQKE
jgi:hypothetical protein